MVDGVVKWFDAKKGYGFVVSPEVGDIFIHYTKIQMEGFKKLETGEKITFDLITSPEGKPQADNVVRDASETPE
jgi:CspA family cold shock protein